jgi:putative transposase
MHVIRAAMRFVSYQDRKKVAAALRPIYTAPTVEAAETELLAFAESALKNRGHFPNDDAVIKLLWLAIRHIEDKRARQRAKEKSLPRDQRKDPGRLVEGVVVQGWKAALGALAIAYPDRLAAYVASSTLLGVSVPLIRRRL